MASEEKRRFFKFFLSRGDPHKQIKEMKEVRGGRSQLIPKGRSGMDFIIWRPSYNLGDPKIDNQHRQLVDLVNCLCAEICRSSSKNIVEKILVQLVHYAEEHFRDEEELMAHIGYPELQEHTEEHVRLVEEVFEFKKKYDDGLVSKEDLVNFLKIWLIDHIIGSDLKIKHWLERKKAA